METPKFNKSDILKVILAGSLGAATLIGIGKPGSAQSAQNKKNPEAPTYITHGQNCGPDLGAFGPNQGIGAYEHTLKVVCYPDSISVSAESQTSSNSSQVCAPNLGVPAFAATARNEICRSA